MFDEDELDWQDQVGEQDDKDGRDCPEDDFYPEPSPEDLDHLYPDEA